MIFLYGPLMSGKKDFAIEILHCKGKDFYSNCICDVQELAANHPDLERLAEELSHYEIVIATEIGGGVVPLDAAQRASREAAGRLNCLLAQRAQTVVRLFCGLPTVLKGRLE